jgi:hypothetical protein
VFRVLTHIKPLVSSCFSLFQRCLLRWTKPSHTSLVLGTVMDLAREKSELIADLLFRSLKIEEIKSKPIHFANGCAK